MFLGLGKLLSLMRCHEHHKNICLLIFNQLALTKMDGFRGVILFLFMMVCLPDETLKNIR